MSGSFATVNPLTLKENAEFLSEHADSYMPGYTGYCPKLKFQCGTSYGSRTKDMLKELSDEKVIYDEIHKTDNSVPPLAKPLEGPKEQHPEDSLDHQHAFQKHIAGYTGCIPLMNRRYGESYGKIAEECFSEFKTEQAHSELDDAGNVKFEEKEVHLDCRPMEGYTGHVPMVEMEENGKSSSNRYYLRD